MTSAKDIVLKPIDRRTADEFIKKNHYSGKRVKNSQLHIGVHLNGLLEGAMQFGSSLDKSKIRGLVSKTPWNGFLELNRMAFSERLPRNSESRALSIALRLIRRHAPHVKWVVSFADATQCGDGTIYRAAGFHLTGINKSNNLARLPNGKIVHKMTLESSPTHPRAEADGRSYFDVTGGKYAFRSYVETLGGIILTGYQIRYIGFVDPSWRENLVAPSLPYSALDAAGARMYRGSTVKPLTCPSGAMASTAALPADDGGSIPTLGLHNMRRRP